MKLFSAGYLEGGLGVVLAPGVSLGLAVSLDVMVAGGPGVGLGVKAGAHLGAALRAPAGRRNSGFPRIRGRPVKGRSGRSGPRFPPGVLA